MKPDFTSHRPSSQNWYLAEAIGCLKRPSFLGLLAGLLLLHALYIYLWYNYLTFFAWLTKEDGVLEYATAALMLLAGCSFLRGAFTSQSRIQKAWALAFAAALVFMAGEEVSWGQRIYGFHWEVLEELNEQNETNLHNLPFINAPRLLTVGCLLLGIIVPITLLFFARLRYLTFDQLRLPLPHPAASLCFLLSNVWARGFHAPPYNAPQALSVEESAEFSIGLACFLYAAIWLFSRTTEKQFRVNTEIKTPFHAEPGQAHHGTGNR